MATITQVLTLFFAFLAITFAQAADPIATKKAMEEHAQRRVLRKLCTLEEPGIFYCKDQSGCVPFQWAMDGVKDCEDGSDENALYWDECMLKKDQCDRTNGICTDSIPNPPKPNGVHQCSCKPGFETVDGGKTCLKMGIA